uniref:Uncharacterized protein n=1 Tax=Candidatus Kentrum sp. DK TaxID=2126562 RepID=A0A450RVY0_9GAMM|nr:MAG: hypothetical protein BECKDK2373B_GA0170837_100514 [Candidatus Kentron sp. DK]
MRALSLVLLFLLGGMTYAVSAGPKEGEKAGCAELASLNTAIKRIADSQRSYAGALAGIAEHPRLRNTLKKGNLSRFARSTETLRHQLSETEWLLNKAEQNPNGVSCGRLALAKEELELSWNLVNQNYGRLSHAEEKAIQGDFRYLEEKEHKAVTRKNPQAIESAETIPYRVGEMVYVSKESSTCYAVIVLPGSTKSKVEYTIPCAWEQDVFGADMEEYPQGYQEWVSNHLLERR